MKTLTLRDGRPLHIREAKPEDASALLGFVRQVADETDFLPFSSAEFDLSEEAEAQILTQYRLSPNEVYLIALVEHAIAGSVMVRSGKRKRLQHSGEVGISVAREYWDLGIGGELLLAAHDWAETNGITRKLNLEVSTRNERAIHLYRKVGYRQEGLRTRSLKLLRDGTGYWDDCLIMGKHIEQRPEHTKYP